MRCNKRNLWAALALLVLSGCVPPSLYAKADRATYDAVAAEYLDYVAADPDLSAEQKARRVRTLTSWRKRTEAAEGRR
jgi:hypothetical protein